jgi:hypothetical protein
MKRIVSWILLVLTVSILVFNAYLAIAGGIDVHNKFEELTERGIGGMERMATGADILAVGVVVLSVVGAILAAITAKLAKGCAMKSVSFVMILCFFLLPPICACLMI